MKGGYKIIDFKHIPLSDAEHPALVPDLRAVLDENYGKAVLLTNVVLGEDSMDDCFSTVILKSNGRIKLNSYDGYITVDSDSHAHYTEGGSGDPTAEIEEIKEDIQDIQTDIGDLSDLTTEEQSSLVGSVNEVNGKVDDVSEDLGDISDLETETKTSSVDAINELSTKLSKTEDLIAYVQTTLVASKAYTAGEQFIYNGLLYKATAAIAQGGTITVGGNCELADSVTEQIKNSKIVSEKYNFRAFTIGGTIGTFATGDYINVSKTGYTPTSVEIAQLGHPAAYFVNYMLTDDNKVYCAIFNGKSGTDSYPAGDVQFRVHYQKSS